MSSAGPSSSRHRPLPIDTSPTKPGRKDYEAIEFGEPDEDLEAGEEETIGLRPLHSAGLRSTIFGNAEDSAPSSSAPPLKRTLYYLLEDPNSSTAAVTIHIFTTALICISAIITILETLPPFHKTPSHVWFGLETSLVVCFTVEYLCRVYAHSDTWPRFYEWFSSFFAIVDLLAIAPYYVELALQADTTAFFRFSILRTFRLLRVFRPFRYSNTILLTIEVMYLSMKRSKDALLALGFFVVMALIVFSTLLYFTERGTWDQALETFVDADGDPSQFSSIPAAGWFVLVTITTVGYGEIIPRSILGRLFTIPLLLFGLLLIALPSFVLGREFSALWEGMSVRGQLPNSRVRADSLNDFLDAHTQTPRSADADSSRPRRAPYVPSDSESPSTSRYQTQYPPRPHAQSTTRPSSSTQRRISGSGRFQRGRQRRSSSLSLLHGAGAIMAGTVIPIDEHVEDSIPAPMPMISNRKLAQNQAALSSQMSEMAKLLGEMRKELAELRGPDRNQGRNRGGGGGIYGDGGDGVVGVDRSAYSQSHPGPDPEQDVGTEPF